LVLLPDLNYQICETSDESAHLKSSKLSPTGPNPGLLERR
jgi:hypothetical protein